MKPPLCGNESEHAYWTSQSFTCPVCARIRKDQVERLARLEFAHMVAERVVALLKENKG